MEKWELYLFLKPKSVLSEKRGTRQPKGWCVPRLLNPNQSLDPEQISLDS